MTWQTYTLPHKLNNNKQTKQFKEEKRLNHEITLGFAGDFLQ